MKHRVRRPSSHLRLVNLLLIAAATIAAVAPFDWRANCAQRGGREGMKEPRDASHPRKTTWNRIAWMPNWNSVEWHAHDRHTGNETEYAARAETSA